MYSFDSLDRNFELDREINFLLSLWVTHTECDECECRINLIVLEDIPFTNATLIKIG